jgi:hypothetical protein
MTEQADPNDSGLTTLLEALTTISYLKRGDGRAAAIAEYALDKYEKTMRDTSPSATRQSEQGIPEGIQKWGIATQSIPGHLPEQCMNRSRQGNERRLADRGRPAGQEERRFNADRRVNPDRRCNLNLGVDSGH